MQKDKHFSFEPEKNFKIMVVISSNIFGCYGYTTLYIVDMIMKNFLISFLSVDGRSQLIQIFSINLKHWIICESIDLEEESVSGAIADVAEKYLLN